MNPQSNPSAYFFDDEDSKTKFEFSFPNAQQEKELAVPPILKSAMVCKNIGSNTSVQGVFALHSGLLAHLPSNGGSETIVLDLSFSRMKNLPDPDQAHGVVVIKNGESYELRFREREIANDWYNALKNVCIMTNFHDEYKATKMIGKGSFAKVYLVDGKTEGKQFAVKAFAKDGIAITSKANPRATMLNEISLMRSLHHENIIRLYEVHETERSIYLVMELVEGRPMQEPLSRKTFKREFSEKKIMEMIGSILDALAYIASKGIMHRDLKPDNIIIDKNGKPKIIDFGLATYINLPEYIFKKCGTPGYIAPEIFKYDPRASATGYNDRCDVFSAGCIFYYMLFGQSLFYGKGASEILRLNKETTDLDLLFSLKKEISDPKNKIGKNEGELLILLLDHDHKKRIPAGKALAHPYFTETNHLTFEFSSKEGLDSPKMQPISVSSLSSVNNADDKHSLSLKHELSDKANSINPSRNRFTMKDSLYLDVGKPEMNGKLDSVANGSFNNSLFNRTDTLNANSTSNFARQTSLNDKNKVQNRSFRGHNTPNNHNFLKAAIFNNMNKNNEPNTPKTPFNQETQSPGPWSNFTTSTVSSSEDFDDVGNEDCKIAANVNKMNLGILPKHPSKKFHMAPK